MVHCGDGSQRLFVLEREGIVRILNHDLELIKEPFLDIHKLVQSGLKVGVWVPRFARVVFLFRGNANADALSVHKSANGCSRGVFCGGLHGQLAGVSWKCLHLCKRVSEIWGPT